MSKSVFKEEGHLHTTSAAMQCTQVKWWGNGLLKEAGTDLHGSCSRLPLLLGDDRHDAAAIVACRVLQADEGVDGVAEEGYVGHPPQKCNLQGALRRSAHMC